MNANVIKFCVQHADNSIFIEFLAHKRMATACLHLLELLNWNADGFQHCFNGRFIILCTQLEQRPRRLHVVQIGVQVGKQNRNLNPKQHRLNGEVILEIDAFVIMKMEAYLAASSEEVSDFRHGHKVGDMGLACCCRSPVNFQVALL